MDDLNEKLAKLLSSPDSLSKIQSAMAALSTEPAAGAANLPTAPPPPAPTPTPSGMPDLAMLGKMAPLLAGINQDDDDTRLLRALKPYLHGQREQRLEETMQLLRLTKLLPLLQAQGILGGKQGGGSHDG